MPHGWIRIRCSLVSALFCCLPTIGCGSSSDSKGEVVGSFASTPLVAAAMTDQGRYTVDLFTAPDQPPTAGIIAVRLRIKEAAQQSLSDDLKVDLTPMMPSMGHGTSEVPPAEFKGSGLYVFPAVDLFMAGRWDLVTEIQGANGTEGDTVTFPVDVR